MRREVKHRGIDVSRWQGNVNWEHVKSSGQVDFAILRIGGCEDEFYSDSKFEYNYMECKRVGIAVGCYYMLPRIIKGKESLIISHFCKLMREKQFEFPICLDVELQKSEHKEDTTNSVIGIANSLEKLGYYVCIYSSSNLGFRTLLDTPKLSAYDKWVAQWGRSAPAYPESYGLWQRSSKGDIPGILGDVDIDSAYYDYPAIIKHAGLNGFTPEPSTFPHCNKNCDKCTHNCPCKGDRPDNCRWDLMKKKGQK